MKGYSKYFWFIHFIGDVFFINIAFVVMYYFKFDTIDFSDKYRFLIIIYNAIWILVCLMLKLYEIKQLKRLDRILFNLFKAFVFNALIMSAVLFSLKASEFSREHLYATYLMLLILIIFWRFIAIQSIKVYRKSGYNYSKIVIVGGGEVAKQLYSYFNSDDVLGVKLMGIFSDTEHTFDVKDGVTIGTINDLETFVLDNSIDEIFYTLPLTYTKKIKSLVDFCDKKMIRFKIVPDFRGFIFKRVNIDFFDDVPVITLREEPLTDFINRFLKRMFDLLFSSFVIIFFLSWIFPILAIIIKLTSKGPILFKQLRSGVNNEEFVCYKFRSMTLSSDSESKQATLGDARITKIGVFLRKTSLDEFPQFINVFLGDMSIVGPRPHMLLHTKEYSELINKYMVRQLVKPGITGVAQIRGYRGETKQLQDMEGRVRFDVWYIENWSLALDINIIFQTLWNILKGDEKAY
ncbi:MAG: undecaprenyl-phosphate glucose phosphotransferase [Flavobacteriales bacterium]|nr:undecaprenyl-phosphate glucose phosphotransferase [Flavobacteriales bacterium]|tara:strand:- start:27587 stop:28972 length:1386 start_codon:yes stop_codon:yes gene_type:complete